MSNKKALIDELNGAVLENRFEDFRPLNVDPISGIRNGPGCLSVVFRAFDRTLQKDVAIKVFDPDLLGIRNDYRRSCFRRESEILERLVKKNRCMQLVQSLEEIDLQIATGPSTFVALPVPYFVIEWLGGDIQDYFLNQSIHDAEIKLEIFRECCLGTFALHNHGIMHRDIKFDNLMKSDDNYDNRGVMAIDLGTAAFLDSSPLLDLIDYPDHGVGARGFAAMEAMSGFAHVRKTGRAQDIYALGCLLFDLFNVQLHYHHLTKNIGYTNCLGTCIAAVNLEKTLGNDESIIFQRFLKTLSQTKSQVTLPDLDQIGGTIPKSIKSLVSDLHHSMTSIDFRDRINNQNLILHRIDTASKILRMEQNQLARLSKKKARTRMKPTQVVRS